MMERCRVCRYIPLDDHAEEVEVITENLRRDDVVFTGSGLLVFVPPRHWSVVIRPKRLGRE